MEAKDNAETRLLDGQAPSTLSCRRGSPHPSPHIGKRGGKLLKTKGTSAEKRAKRKQDAASR